MNIIVKLDQLIQDPLPFSKVNGLLQNAAPRVTNFGKRIVVVACYEGSLLLDEFVQKIEEVAKKHPYSSLAVSEEKGGQELVFTLRDFYRVTDFHFENSLRLKVVAKLIKPPLNRHFVEKGGFLEGCFISKYSIGKSPFECIHTNVLSEVLLPKLRLKDILSLACLNSFMKKRIEVLLFKERYSLPRNCFGKKAWLKIPRIKDIGDEPPIPQDFYRRWFSPCPFFEGKKVYETHCLVLVPDTINQKPHSVINFNQFLSDTFYEKLLDIKGSSSAKYLHKEAPKSHWLFMTKTLVPQSIGQFLTCNNRMVASKGYRVLSALEAMTSLFILKVFNQIEPSIYATRTTDSCEKWRAGNDITVKYVGYIEISPDYYYSILTGILATL